MALFAHLGKENAPQSRAGEIVQGMNKNVQDKKDPNAIIEKEGMEGKQEPPKAEKPKGDPQPPNPAPNDKPAGASAKEPAGKEEPPKPEPPQLSEESVFNFLSERLKREVKSFDDLTVKEERQLDPEIKELMDWKEKTGLPLSKFADYTKDFSKMGDLDVAKEILAQQYPYFTEEELAYSLRDFIYDEDMDEEEEKLKKSVALKKFAAEGRKQLEENKLKLSSSGNALTQEQQQQLQEYAQIKQNMALQAQNAEQYHNSLKEAVTKFEPVNLKLTEDLNINYDVSSTDRNGLVDHVLKMPHWYNEDGSVNHKAILQDGLKIRDFDTIIQKVFEQGINVGREGKIKADKNITLANRTDKSSAGDGKKRGNIDEVVDKLGTSKSRKLRFGNPNKS